MIELYTFTTPNGRKPAIMLEEIALPHTVHRVDITKGEQQRPEFLAVNPNGKIPAIVDRGAEGGPLSVFESGAILIYLAEKSGKLLPTSARGRATTLEWLFWQNAGLGPMSGQLSHFAKFAKEKIPYAIERYTAEVKRLFKVLDGRLGEAEHLAGEYSIADISTFPWVDGIAGYFPEVAEGLTNVARWRSAVAARPAVQRGMKVLESAAPKH